VSRAGATTGFAPGHRGGGGSASVQLATGEPLTVVDPLPVDDRPVVTVSPPAPVPAGGSGGTGRRFGWRVRPGWRFVAVALGLIVAAALIAPLAYAHLDVWVGQRMVDLSVYREGGRSVLLGRPVYGYVTPWPQYLPFTYPPFAALLATALSLGSQWHDAVLWTVGEALCTAGLSYFGFRRLLPRFGRWAPVAFGVLVGAVSWLEPFRDEIRFGQVDELLALLCVLDCMLRRPRWPRGLLIGLATAIKLTPGVFIPYLWLTGRRRAALTAAGTFAGAGIFTAIVLPQASGVFWLQDIFEPQRTGLVNGTSNQSLRGLTDRLPLPSHLGDVLWIAGLLVIGWVGFRRAAQAQRAGDELAAVTIVGLLAVLLSPIAWIHHLAWLPLVLGTVVATGRDRRRVLAAVAIFGLFALALPWWGAELVRNYPWAAPVGWLVQNCYGLAAIGLVCRLPYRGEPERPTLDLRGLLAGAAEKLRFGRIGLARSGALRSAPVRPGAH
jgi:alpha-1,2-mannosyltransferase